VVSELRLLIEQMKALKQTEVQFCGGSAFSVDTPFCTG